jgi:hypothetical protein
MEKFYWCYVTDCDGAWDGDPRLCRRIKAKSRFSAEHYANNWSLSVENSEGWLTGWEVADDSEKAEKEAWMLAQEEKRKEREKKIWG